MLFRMVFFSGGAGKPRFRPIRSAAFVAAICIAVLAVWTAVEPPTGLVGSGWLLLAPIPGLLLLEIVLVVLGLQGVVGAKLAMGREGFVLPNLFEGQRKNRAALLVALSLIASLYWASAAVLTPFTAITFNGDGCAEWASPFYRFLLLAVNMVPGYEACIEEPPLVYRTARYVINVMIAGTFIANLPDLVRSAGGRGAA